jgi:hypothetical protein
MAFYTTFNRIKPSTLKPNGIGAKPRAILFTFYINRFFNVLDILECFALNTVDRHFKIMLTQTKA